MPVDLAMRVLLVLLVLTAATAMAEPPHRARAPIEIAPSAPTTRLADRVPGLHGFSVLGLIWVPPLDADSRDWSEGGMVMRPPETGDDNVLVPGFDSLPWFRRERPRLPLGRQLLRGLERGVGAIIDLVVPPAS
ncbi:MAG: hypothetical protein H6Q90_4319 [Deltaproteobacteria bacterium]|nr:hypothetical protein [Deltaproteobacteria bacterium]